MSLDSGDLAVVLGVVALGPWGLVLVVALVRGYSLSLRLSRPRSSVAGMSETPVPAPEPAVVVPAVAPVVVEPDPPPVVDEERLGEVVERAEVTPDQGDRE